MGNEAWADFEAIKVNQAGSIVTVRLNRPRAANAINWAMETEIYKVLRDCETDDSVKCVLVTAEGRHFSAGHDIREIAEEMLGGAEPKTIDGKSWHRTNEILPPWWFNKALVVAVKGYIGPHANTLLLAADVVIAAENSKFDWGETRIGTGTPFGNYSLMPFHFPMRVFKQLWLAGGWMDAETARQLFYVNRVVPLGEEEEAATKYAEFFAKMALGAIVANKRGIHKCYEAAGLLQMAGAGRDPFEPDESVWDQGKDHLQTIQGSGAGAAARVRDEGLDTTLTQI
jgi:enoyl-CoA hydratase/carnithine racemase